MIALPIKILQIEKIIKHKPAIACNEFDLSGAKAHTKDSTKTTTAAIPAT